MALVASPYGLVPINRLGGTSYNGGTVRMIPMTVNHATQINTGDVIVIGAASAGQPSAATATVTTSSAGVLGVCMGVSYVDPTLKQQQFSLYLPGGAVTAGYTNILIHVNDDPDQLYKLQSAGSVARTVQGKFCALENFGSGTYGNSTIRGSTPANTATLAMRIVDFASTPGDAYTDLIVKFNAGVLMWDNTTVLTN
jgi:hypothetical protein